MNSSAAWWLASRTLSWLGKWLRLDHEAALLDLMLCSYAVWDPEIPAHWSSAILPSCVWLNRSVRKENLACICSWRENEDVRLLERYGVHRPAAVETPFFLSRTRSSVLIWFLHLRMSWQQSVLREEMGLETHLLAAVLLWTIKPLTKETVA